MTSALRVAAVIAVVAAATWGEGGASASSLLVQHLVLAAAVAGCLLAAPGAACAPARRPAAAWLAFAVLAAIGAALAPYAYAAWLVLVEIAAFGALAWLAAGEAPLVERALAPAIALIASAHGVAAAVQRLGGISRPASTFLNPNHLAAWLAAAALLLLGRLLAQPGPARGRPAYAAAAAASLLGIAVTGSRGAAAGLVVGGAALLALSWGTLSGSARRLTLAVALGVALVAGAGVVLRFRSDDDPYRFHRTRIWAASLGAVVRSPWRGTGPGQFAAAAPNLNFPLEGAPLRFERSFRTPHSDALRAVCEFGIPAALAAFAAMGLAAREFLLRRRDATAASRGAFAALVALAAQGAVDDLTTRPAITILAAVLAGVVVASPRTDEGAASGRGPNAAVAALVVLVLGIGEIAGFLAWSAAHALPRGRLDAAHAARLRRALSWNPMQPDSWSRLAEHEAGDATSWRAADYAAAREAAEHARRLQPSDAVYARAAARIEASACLSLFPFLATRERTARLYGEAEALARTDATIPFEAAKFLLQAGDAAGARRAALRALKIEPRAPAPRLWLARAILQDEGAPASARVRRLLDEADSLAPRPGETPTSPYDASLRFADPQLAAALRRDLDRAAAPR